MKITSAEFVVGVAGLRHLPGGGRKEVAFLGRSNVGKSSLINRLCGRKALARSSSEPGKTRELNFYLVNGSFHFVDLPGYGYAHAPEQVRSGWGKLIEQYLKNREELRLVVQLVDARHDPTELDIMMVGWLEYFHIPFLVALTKADKIPRSKIGSYVNSAKSLFKRYSFCREVVPFSAVSGEGKTEVLSVIAQHLTGAQSNAG